MTVHVLAVLKGAVEGDALANFASLNGIVEHLGQAGRSGSDAVRTAPG